MQRLLYFIALLGCAVSFPSCSPARLYYQPLTQRPSQPWEGNSSSWGGYTENTIDKNRVRVAFETFNRPGSEFASYFVNVRAAEIALARGKNTFWLDDEGTQQWTETSHFPEYIDPGYWHYEEREVTHCSSDCKKGCREHTEILRESFWVPERYVPPHTSVNLLSIAQIIMSTKPPGTRFKATDIIGDALSNSHDFGKPSFSSDTMNAYEARITKPTH
jgi:hypothetical protein|tara:strand:+ start:157 stop:810 length:654 start_codon:yes stop_codon:yes gene_type:complete